MNQGGKENTLLVAGGRGFFRFHRFSAAP